MTLHIDSLCKLIQYQRNPNVLPINAWVPLKIVVWIYGKFENNFWIKDLQTIWRIGVSHACSH